MKYYLGIDGGGTKTKFTLCDDNLNIVNEYIGPGCHYLQRGFDGVQKIMSEGLAKVCGTARDDNASISRKFSSADINYAFAGCAGYGDVAADTPLIGDAIRRGLGNVPVALGNDCENALAGAIGDRPGINIIAGTGSVGCGKNSRGDYARCGGWHHVLGGDEGSGYWISWRLIQEFQRQSDGRDERSLLYDRVRQALHLDTDDEIVSRIVGEWNLDRTRIASLAPLVCELAVSGDEFAKAILHDGAAQLAEFAIALYRKLDFRPEDGIIPCSGTGGVFKMGEPVTAAFSEMLAAAGMKYMEPISEPDIGAVILAMKHDNLSI